MAKKTGISEKYLWATTVVLMVVGAWMYLKKQETVGIAKHRFSIPVGDKAGKVFGVQCKGCGKIVEFENDFQIPPDVLVEECIPEDFSQAAARIAREAIKD